MLFTVPQLLIAETHAGSGTEQEMIICGCRTVLEAFSSTATNGCLQHIQNLFVVFNHSSQKHVNYAGLYTSTLCFNKKEKRGWGDGSRWAMES